MSDKDFLEHDVHYSMLVSQLPQAQRELYAKLQHLRIESAYHNRRFAIYTMVRREAQVLDWITINDFRCDDEHGASCEIFSEAHPRPLLVSYRPTQVYEYPIFFAIPLRTNIRWATSAERVRNGERGSLAFPLMIRTASRRHLRERDVVYCETGRQFGEEFLEDETAKVAETSRV